MARNFNKTLGQRLRQVRMQLGLTLREVSKQMGFNNYQTLCSIEEGLRQTKASELAKLAKIYLRDISYFLNPEQVEEAEPVVVWRVRPNKDKIKRQSFLKYCHNYYDLEKRLDLDSKSTLLQPSNLTAANFDYNKYSKVKDIATKYYNYMQLGARPACTLEKILEENYNVKIIYLNLGAEGSAASAVGEFGTAILINSSEAPWRRNYNLAHELFHIITWDIFKCKDDIIISDEKPILEKWADAFASYLLLPQDEVIKECKARVEDGKISLLDLIEVARKFVVSTEALLWRLVNLGPLDKDIVKNAIESGKIKALDKIQRLGDWAQAPLISAKYINLAFKAYQKGLISKGKLAEYLDINISEVNSELQKYGYNVTEVYEEEFAYT